MSSWLPAWLPALPSIDFSLPASIQKRFLSFALRQALGHLLKPGQLDIQQVDSQIGSGFVQVRDVELDNEAINSLIAGLPIRLHDGSVGKVTARIPWPNPLTAAIGLSLESLHLTFNVIPTVSRETSTSVNLAESVTSVAETFIHSELDPDEEITLRDSFHPDLSASSVSLDYIPGGLDPFVTEGLSHGDTDPRGVSIFATLLERLLARFQFDATDIKITLVHPDHACFTLAIPRIQYQTNVKGEPSTSETTTGASDPQPSRDKDTTRTVSITGVTLTTRCLRGQGSPPISSPTQSAPSYTAMQASVEPPSPPSPGLSDSSELDEATHLMMSQSLVGLPPRPPSPASSVASSMYQSAISVAPTSLPSPPGSRNFVVAAPDDDGRATPTSPSPAPVPVPPFQHSPPAATREIQDETILSFGSEPIVVRLSTPAATSSSKDVGTSIKSTTDTKKGQGSISESVPRLDVSLGVIAVALKARHLRSIMDLGQLWASHSPVASPGETEAENEQQPRRSLFDHVEANLQLRGLVALLTPARDAVSEISSDPLAAFFEHPLIPPPLPHGYVRVHLDGFNISASMTPVSQPPLLRGTASKPQGTVFTASVTLAELSAFAYLTGNASDAAAGELRASPILITDPNLTLQYPATHNQPNLRRSDNSAQLPSFDIVDWTDPAQFTTSSKLSLWRTKVPPNSRFPGQGLPHGSPSSISPLRDSPFRTASSPRQGFAGPSSPSSRHEGIAMRPHRAAVSVKFSMTSQPPNFRSSRRKGKAPESSTSIEVSIAPLHAFCDVALLLASPYGEPSDALVFLETLTADDTESQLVSGEPEDVYNDEDESDEDDEDTPPATPQPSSPFLRRANEREQERERKRLERMVLEDLDLGFDYRSSEPEPMGPYAKSQGSHWRKKRKSRKASRTEVKITFPLIRLEARASPDPVHARRSGAVLLDIHDLCLFPGGLPHVRKPTTRFADPQGAVDVEGLPVIRQDVDDALLFGECERLTISYAVADSTKAHVLFSLGATIPEQESQPRSWTGSPPSVIHAPHRLRPQFTVSQSSSRPSPESQELATLTVTVDIPAVFVKLGKPIFDGLQLWADDLSQMLEKCSRSATSSEKGDSRDASLIGSRFFAKTRRSQDSGTDSASVVSAQRTNANTETILKVFVADVAVRLDVPRNDGVDRPFDMLASGIDVLMEVHPEGKDETVVTLGIAELNVIEHAKDGTSSTFLSLTRPHGISTSGQSLLKLRFVSLTLPETNAKESRIKVTLSGVTYTLYPDLEWTKELGKFAKAPPGVFESVPPSERTRISIKLVDTSLRALAPSHPGALVLYLGELDFSTVIEGNIPQTSLTVLAQSTSLLLHDDCSSISDDTSPKQLPATGRGSSDSFWKVQGYALLTELDGFNLKVSSKQDVSPPDVRVTIDGADLRLHLCADSGGVLGAFIGSMTSMFSGPSVPPPEVSHKKRGPTEVASPPSKRSLLASLDEQAFKRQIPAVGPAPDLVNDDLPNNPDYLDDAFNASGGLRALEDDELDDFNEEYSISYDQPDIIGKHGGETIRLLDPKGLNVIENYFELLPPDSADEANQYGDTTLRVRVNDCNVTVLLYDGYDWARTRRIIEEQQREMLRRLAKIRQLVANGQTPDPSVEETNTVLFNSVYIGLEHNVDEFEPTALIAAIDEQLNEDLETASQSSWQSLKPQQLSPGGHNPMAIHKRSKKKLTRSKGPCIEFRLQHLDAEVDNYRFDPELASRILATVRDVEILDHVRTSTWSKFLTSLSTDSKGNIRETGSNMVRVELRKVYPVPGDTTEEARLRAKLLPLRLYVDQDALDFMKKFFSFSDPEAAPASSEPSEEIFFQQVEVFPVDIKLDYKPRRVDYRALRSGRTIELMNFFHFDGAEMTLRHITLTGITGWARVGDLLNDLWTPDVKATQLVDVISGVAPIRSVVNVGSGVADLVLLPIAQYKKDGRVIRGLQKGTTAFVQSTAIEAIKLGARLATGTQVILEQAEHVIGGQFNDDVMAEAVQLPAEEGGNDLGEADELISKYAEQPMNVKEGVRSAMRSLKRNFNSAAQTILAVPMEVYERSGNEGAVRAVVRAVPIAVLKPMIGASEAVSQTLMGIHNSLDPSVRTENEAKYKHR